MNQNERRRWLLHALLEEMPQYQYPVFPYTAERQWRLLRSLMNVRPPMPAGEEFLKVQDAFLREMTAEKGVTDGDSLPACKGDERLVLWQGDITRLAVDAVVNAANSAMLGCFRPCHNCIDNCIHTFAGIQLRQACGAIMEAQGTPEAIMAMMRQIKESRWIHIESSSPRRIPPVPKEREFKVRSY